MKRAVRVRREGQDDLRWKINEVVMVFKKKDEFSLLAAGDKKRNIKFRNNNRDGRRAEFRSCEELNRIEGKRNGKRSNNN